MGQKMTWKEIQAQYPETFVLLDNCEEIQEFENKILITQGEVIFSTQDGKEIYNEYCKRGQLPHMTFGHTRSDKLEIEEVSFMGIRPSSHV
jgi:hypothetical protein